ncbi:hypothetical protein B0H11DRAFT_2218486 [Mycena galericulata]|nr:hypothetical protein B0H11DRAFT_2218486 [Mycena galericulata]
MRRMTAKERHAAQQNPSYYAVPGPSIPHPLAKVPSHVNNRPDIVLANGRTLIQPCLPPLLARAGLGGEILGGADNEDAREGPDGDAYDERDIVPPDRTPPPDPTQHRRKRAAQWQRWQGEVIPNLLPHFARFLHSTKSMRHYDGVEIPRKTCQCVGRVLKVAVVHFSSIEDLDLTICACAPAAVQLMCAGAFPCAPLSPSLAVDMRVLAFTADLFLHIAPNNTAFAQTLERSLSNMGFQLDHTFPAQNSLRRRFGNCLMWYTHMRNLHKERYSQIIEATRIQYLAPPANEESPSPPPVAPAILPQPGRGRAATREGSASAPRSSSAASSSPSQGSRSSSASSGTPTPGSPNRDHKRKRFRERTPDPPQVPFPEPPPRTRPSEYLRRRCPACFGNLTHDPGALSDVKVCVDACFTQKSKVSPRDPPKTHPKTHFVPEAQAALTEAYVDSVRGQAATEKKKRARKATIQEVPDVDDGYDHPDLLLPRSVLDGCEASFKAADEKREKASTKFFEDTGLMALLCRHDRVLWLINMHSAGEKQFNVVALVETLFQHLPPDIAVGLLYDVVCAFERSCRKWGFLSRFIDRLTFAVSVFHAFGHEWPCQLLFHPRKRTGFGFSDGEGSERLWNCISHLIAILRVTSYHNRLYTLDSQLEHADEASLLRLGEWIRRRHAHCVNKRVEAQKALGKSGKSVSLLREQWAMQVKAQTKPLPRQSKNRGRQAVNAVVLLRAALKTRQAKVRELRDKFLEAVEEENQDAGLYQVELEAATEAVTKAEEKLRKKEKALGVDQRQELKRLATSQYIRLRMNARTQAWNDLSDGLLTKLYSHTESAVKRREPTISKLNSQYNKLCGDLKKLISDHKAPAGAVAPEPIPAKGMWQLDVDDGIWQDVGLDDDDDERSGQPPGEPPLWLSDEKVRSGIKAMLELDRCDEEDVSLKKERCALQVWFAEEWTVLNLALQDEECEEDRYQLELLRDNLVRLCATWQKALPDLGVDETTLPPWGPTAAQLSTCIVHAHLPARGENRYYRSAGDFSDDDGGEEDIEAGGEEEDYSTLEALERADFYREPQNDDL